ncbi:MAG TPA: FAD-dependent oxidoreductase [Williamwhitmania sp.]|nr:FAD-dependent oxidoreductase [Williamwhitmania sp.]
MDKSVAVIGGGVAGIETAAELGKLGYKVMLFERAAELGGNVRNWDRLFPSRRPAKEVIENALSSLNGEVSVYTSTSISSVKKENGAFTIQSADSKQFQAGAVVLTTGFELFPAEKKEEYGYRIFENVITSGELEKMFADYGKPRMTNGKTPHRVAFIHCVGSRDEKVNRPYCSKVCCVTAVKQAIEVKEAIPSAEVFCFYMDLRMFGHGYEQLYKEAQVMGINFVRGRLSETSEAPDGRVNVKVEDTLASKPMRLSTDMVVLMVGMTPAVGTDKILNSLGLKTNEDGFAPVKDVHMASTQMTTEGVFVAGACTGPNNITDSITEARSAALQVHGYLNGK